MNDIRVNNSRPGEPWPEARVKRLLNEYGIHVPRGFVVSPDTPVDAALAQAENLQAPYVAKVHDVEVLHKTDVGGVVLNLGSVTELQDALNQLRERFRGSQVLVEEQAPEGVEFIVGLLKDADFGPSIMVGFGGVFTELYKDVSFRVLPVTRTDCEDMLSQLTAEPLLTGYRGLQADREALIDLLLRLNDLADDWGSRLEGMDLNPVLIHEEGVTVVDAKLVVEGEE